MLKITSDGRWRSTFGRDDLTRSEIADVDSWQEISVKEVYFRFSGSIWNIGDFELSGGVEFIPELQGLAEWDAFDDIALVVIKFGEDNKTVVCGTYEYTTGWAELDRKVRNRRIEGTSASMVIRRLLSPRDNNEN